MTAKSFLFAIVLLVFSAATAMCQGHTIRGKVRTASGNSLPQTTVSLESGNGGLINQTVTNNEGDFVFAGLEETSYIVTVSMPDYNPVAERIDFVRNVTVNDPGETRTVEITMVRKGEASASRPEVNFVQDVPKDARDSFDSGMRLLKAGKHDEAIASLEQAVKIFPDYFNAHFFLAREFVSQHKLNEAVVQLDQARRVNPKDDRVFQEFGMILLLQKKYAVAARIFAEAANLNPREIQYLVLQGTALIDQASTIDPKSSSEAKAERDYDFSEAEHVLLRAYKLSGERYPAIHLQLARLYEKLGDLKKAATELEEFLKQSPNDQRAPQIREAVKKLRGST